MSKTVKFTVVYHLEEEVPDDWDENSQQFYFEENHCLDNHVTAMNRKIEKDPGYCQTCPIGEAYIGHIPFAEIRRVSERHGDVDD